MQLEDKQLFNFIKHSRFDHKQKWLCSFVTPIEKINIFSLLNIINESTDRYFYFSNASENFNLVGLSQAAIITEQGENRYLNTKEKLIELKNDFVSNWGDYNIESLPLVLGCLKFDSNTHQDIWKEFNESDWFIPKFIFYSSNGKYFFIYNFYSDGTNNSEIEHDYSIGLKLLKTSFKSSKENTDLPLALSDNTNNDFERNNWKNNVHKILESISAGEIEKVVLSRKIEIYLQETPVASSILFELNKNFPDCYTFAYKKNDSLFFGASPEKLLKISSNQLETEALAGSGRRGFIDIEDEKFRKALQISKKNLNEHRAVVNFIVNSISKFTSEISFDDKPIVKQLPNIQHLWTPITGKLKSRIEVFDILEELFPTPAICGVPRNTALKIINRLENFDRGLFGSTIGWFNLENDCEFAVAIRSALLIKNKLYTFAGCGIVEGSNAVNEFAETELKLQPILSLFTNEKIYQS